MPETTRTIDSSMRELTRKHQREQDRFRVRIKRFNYARHMVEVTGHGYSGNPHVKVAGNIKLGSPDRPVYAAGDHAIVERQQNHKWLCTQIIPKVRCGVNTDISDIEVETDADIASAAIQSGDFGITLTPLDPMLPDIVPLGDLTLPNEALPLFICGIPICTDCVPVENYVLTVIDGCWQARPKSGSGGSTLGCSGTPVFVGSLNWDSQSLAGSSWITTYCHYAYAIARTFPSTTYELYALDISDGTAMVELSHQAVTWSNFVLTSMSILDGKWLVVSGYNSSSPFDLLVKIFDLTDPANPNEVFGWNDPTSFGALFFQFITFEQLHKRYGIWATTHNVYYIYDITNPQSGMIAGNVAAVNASGFFEYWRGYVYSIHNSDLYVADVSDPTSTSVVTNSSFFPTPPYNGHAMDNGILFIGLVTFEPDHSYVCAVDCYTDPANPTILATYELTALAGADDSNWIAGFALCCHNLYVIGTTDAGSSYIIIPVDVTDPTAMVAGTPVSLGSLLPAGYFTAEDGRLYIGGEVAGEPNLSVFGS